jgi:hypothetical protein
MLDMKDSYELAIETLSTEIADYSVGFVTLSRRDGFEDAHPAGSGSLVTVGPIHGILTAGHVLTELPDNGSVGLVRFPRTPSAQKLVIEMGHCEKLVISGNQYGPEGPDLGFLNLSPIAGGSLKAVNSFFNLSKRRDSILADSLPDAGRCFDGLAGVIAEWTMDLPPERGLTRVKRFNALFGVGPAAKPHFANGYDLLDFEVTYGPGSESPLRRSRKSGLRHKVWRAQRLSRGPSSGWSLDCVLSSSLAEKQRKGLKMFPAYNLHPWLDPISAFLSAAAAMM